jgi:hypothetical protein
MAFKVFEEEEIKPYILEGLNNISLSEDSLSSGSVHFLTGIRTIGKIGTLYGTSGEIANFGLNDKKEIKYKFDFTSIPLLGQALSADVITGVYSSSADQVYESEGGNENIIEQQRIFDHVQAYLYRPEESYDPSATSLRSSSTSVDISTVRLISLRKQVSVDGIKPTSFKIEINRNIETATGYSSGVSGITDYVDTNASGYTSALDLKNPSFTPQNKSFFGVPMNRTTYHALESMDNIVDGITIEAIIRPYKEETTIFFRRLANSSDINTRNKFMKLELTKSPDGTKNAFRFYIRNTTNYPNNTNNYNERLEGSFSEDFSTDNIQASGLFIPEDAGVNIFDGGFHHLVVSWSIYELSTNDIGTAENGSGVVMGYIDGYKLLNKEEVIPRLQGSDGANGPVVQSNMLEQRIPFRNERLRTTDNLDGPSGNNIFIGVSNYNRDNGDFTGDKGDLPSNTDYYLESPYDGQIQHLRVWNQRLNDSTLSYKELINNIIPQPSATDLLSANPLGESFNNFFSSSLTSVSASNIVGWWNFNNINSTTASDIAGGLSGAEASMTNDPTGNLSSSTGYVIGNGIMNLYDNKDITLGSSGNVFTDLSASGIYRTFLYFDQPQLVKPIKNSLNQSSIIRKNINNEIKRIGTIFYDTSEIVIDNDDPNTLINFTWPTSGNQFGFDVSDPELTAFNVERIRYNYVENKGRLFLEAVAEGDEFNITNNRTGKNAETQENIFDSPTSFITTVGMYNYEGDLLAVAKLSRPIKKDDSIKLQAQVKLDF